MGAMAEGFRIDGELAGFLTGGNSMIVATRSKSLDPDAVRACGIVVLGPTRVAVLVPRATGARALANLRETGDVAVVACCAASYRTVQLKGRCLAIAEATPEDIAASQEQLRGFAASIVKYGWTRQKARNLWLFDLWRIEVEVTSAYGQTPGPGAGAALGAERGR